MNKLFSLLAAAVVATTCGVAAASTVFTDADGNIVSIDGIDGAAPITFTETNTSIGGEYSITNNILGGFIAGFGVTNTGSLDQLVFTDGSCCGEAFILDESNWDLQSLGFGGTGFEIFGDISNVLSEGENVVHWYQNQEVPYGQGFHDGFGFAEGRVNSNLIGLIDVRGTGPLSFFQSSDIAPPATIPLPAGGVLLIAGLGGLVALRRRQTT